MPLSPDIDRLGIQEHLIEATVDGHTSSTEQSAAIARPSRDVLPVHLNSRVNKIAWSLALLKGH